MESIHYLEWRYAVKKFDSERLLPAAKLERLKQAFNLTATSYGLQPIKLVVIQDKGVQQKLIEHSYGQAQVYDASHVLVICVENNIDEAYITKYFQNVKEIRGTSDAILDPFKESLVQSFSKKEKKEVKRWATNQAYLAMGNLLAFCALEKIDSCPMEGFVPEQYDKLLNLDQLGLNSVLVLPVGYRDSNDAFSSMKKVRKPLTESVIELNQE